MKLFLCFTPLHVLVSRGVIESLSASSTVGIYISLSNSAKDRFYFERLSEICDKSFFMLLSSSRFSSVLRILWWYLLRERNLRFDSVYCANYKMFYGRYLCWLLDIKNFYSFDDGLANLSSSSFCFEREDSPWIKLFFSLFNRSFLYKELITKIQEHYTIYPLGLVCRYGGEKVSFLQLKQQFDDKTRSCEASEAESASEPSRLSILLGCAFSHFGFLSAESELEMENRAIIAHSIEHYLPHPRGLNTNAIEADVIETDLVAEDYILNLVSAGIKVKLYGFCSSALINLSSVEGVISFNIEPPFSFPGKAIFSAFDKIESVSI